MVRNCMWGIALLFVSLISACRDEEPVINATVLGKWNGSEADFKINPSGIIPAFTLSEEEFPVLLEFKAGGVVILTDNKGVKREGTYSQAGDKLTIEIDYTFELIELSGTYQINELTNTTLQLEMEKEGSYTHPDTGQEFDGKVTATLYFSRGGN
ncbi:MAG TPA: hypothetical protein VGD40_17445 [Chryseosolibacter sp.]